MPIAFPEPDEGVLARRDESVAGLARPLGPEALIASEDGRRAFETDVLTAYRRLPLVVVLPSSTEQVAAVMRFCHGNGAKVVPRGAGTSLAGGAIPLEDVVVLGVSKVDRVLEAGATNLAVSEAVSHEGFFYAPGPSSQLV